jgi:DeoR family transcriptional regulator, suf operon transcriptional repressor
MTPEPVGEPAPHGYSTPKRSILTVLKQSPDASLEEVARRIGISKVAALGHLQKLEHEGLVDRSYRAGKVGRPRVQFRLAPRASALFPQSYAEVSVWALEFIERKLGAPAVAELLAERAHDVADRARPRLRAPDLGERVRELARIRTEGGYMAEVGSRRGGSVEMLEHNCPILALAGRFPIACETERRMFSGLLRADVDVTHRVVAGDPVCRFRVRPAKELP